MEFSNQALRPFVIKVRFSFKNGRSTKRDVYAHLKGKRIRLFSFRRKYMKNTATPTRRESENILKEAET